MSPEEETNKDALRVLDLLTEGYDTNLETQLSAERVEELELSIQQDENPIRIEEDEDLLPKAKREKRKLKRQLQAEALTRLEEAARTVEDFRNLQKQWDKLDRNWERRERYHEIQRDEIPLDHGRDDNGSVFPVWLKDPNYYAIQKGRNLDVIFNCTYELHQFTSHPILIKIFKYLKTEYKDVLFFTIIREMSTREFGELLDQSDRNVRKKRMRLINRIRRELYDSLKNKSNLSLREKRFLEAYQTNTLAEYDEAEARCAG